MGAAPKDLQAGPLARIGTVLICKGVRGPGIGDIRPPVLHTSGGACEKIAQECCRSLLVISANIK